jgi:hypothetical protein
MKWYNPFSYFSATTDETVEGNAAPVVVKEEGNPIAAVFLLIIVGVLTVLFYRNCRPIGQRMGKNGKMETIYDCTGNQPVQTVMYAQPPQQVVYAQPPQQVVYAHPQAVVQQPGGIFGFGRRR